MKVKIKPCKRKHVFDDLLRMENINGGVLNAHISKFCAEFLLIEGCKFVYLMPKFYFYEVKE